MYHMI